MDICKETSALYLIRTQLRNRKPSVSNTISDLNSTQEKFNEFIHSKASKESITNNILQECKNWKREIKVIIYT